LLLAAVSLDACDDEPAQAVVVARRTVQRLDLGARVEQAVAALVNDVDLMRAASRRNDGLSEEAVLQIAVHLDSVEQADALYRLSLAGSDVDRNVAGQLEALYELVLDSLAHPDLVGREARNEVEARRVEAARFVTDVAVKERIRTAPRAYVLAQAPVDLARQAGLCEPPLGRHEVRVEVDQEGDRARIEVGARDRVGLIARMTLALFESDCEIEQASAATWGDGSAVASYQVRSASALNSRTLHDRVTEMLRTPLVTPPLPDVDVTYDDASSPWHTRCTVTGPDRPGLLHALTASFAAAGLSVHSARVTTDGDRVVDSFELTDTNGAKLDDRAKARVIEVTRQGAVTRRRRFTRRERYMTRVRTKPSFDDPAWSA
jgi:[protein-PII] uridylyltransferase